MDMRGEPFVLHYFFPKITQINIARLCNFQHGDELDSYKVKLENFYTDTDVKEQTFQDF